MAYGQNRGMISRAIHFVGRAIRNYFLLIGFLVTVTPFLIVWTVKQNMKKGPHEHHSSLSTEHPVKLELDLSGKIAQHEPGFTEQLMSRLFHSESDLYLPELRATLRRAAKDARVEQLIVDMGPLGGSPADYSELRRILSEFREGGKKLTVVITNAEDWSYYVATAATTIVLNPASPVTIPGPVFQLVYFGDALKKIGVDIDVVRAGKFKSAFEPFVQNEPSPATVEEYKSMQKSLLDHIISLVAQGRHKDEATVRDWYKRSIFTGTEAISMGMVDSLGYEAEGAPHNADEDHSMLSVKHYEAEIRGENDPADDTKGNDAIGLIEAVGEINLSEQGSNNPTKSDGITPAPMLAQIRKAMRDKEVKAVVLRVSSPGGSAIASDIIWKELKDLAAVKPLVVSMGAYAASGGYYISAPAKYIVAEPTTVTGSIGVIGMLPSASQLAGKYGVSFYIISSSDRRNLLNLGSRATPEDKAVIEKTIDQVYQGFLKNVAEGRHMPVEKVAALAQGRVYTGVQAKELGLVDELGGLQAAYTAAKKFGGLDPTKLYPVHHFDEDSVNWSECVSNPRKMMKCLQQSDSTLAIPENLSTAVVTWLTPTPTAAESTALTLNNWLVTARREGALAIWPGYLGVTAR